MPTIGFIGLGNMGAHMARNLIKGGHKLIVHDAVPKAVEVLKQAGADVASSPAEIASRCETIVTMLPSSPHVQEVYGGSEGIFKRIQPDTLCMDSSTIEPTVSVQMSSEAQRHSSIYLDAPVSGGVVAAQNAGLTFMVGGSPEGFTRAQPFLTLMGKNVVHTGAPGTGQAAKICNNMLLAIGMIGTSEAMLLGQRLGLDAKMLARIINMSSGRCWSSELYNPVPGVVDGVPSSRNYEGGFGAALMAKDLGLAQNAATTAASPTPFGSLAHQFYRMLANDPNTSTKDFSVIYQLLDKKQQA